MENKRPPVAVLLTLGAISLVMALFSMSIAVTAFYADRMGLCLFAGFASYINLSNFIKGMALVKSIEAKNESNDSNKE